jgi:hypothetical protein
MDYRNAYLKSGQQYTPNCQRDHNLVRKFRLSPRNYLKRLWSANFLVSAVAVFSAVIHLPLDTMQNWTQGFTDRHREDGASVLFMDRLGHLKR